MNDELKKIRNGRSDEYKEGFAACYDALTKDEKVIQIQPKCPDCVMKIDKRTCFLHKIDVSNYRIGRPSRCKANRIFIRIEE